MGKIAQIGSFGGVAAELDDAILSYFLETSAVDKIRRGECLLVLGRKGSGKTALVQYFKSRNSDHLTDAPTLRDYPWEIHQKLVNSSASPIEKYVTSWRYLIAVRALATIVDQSRRHPQHDSIRTSREFLEDNFSQLNPSIIDIIQTRRLKLTKLQIKPSFGGASIASLDMDADAKGVPPEIDKISDVIMRTVSVISSQTGFRTIHLHFDELDQGLLQLDPTKKEVITGLILAARSIRNFSGNSVVKPTIYLRTDIWNELSFADKNKISQASSVQLEWDLPSLQKMIEKRIRYKLSNENASWNSIDDGKLMRGKQKKFSYVVSRTFDRPRDVIHFLNLSIDAALAESVDAECLTNAHIKSAKKKYSGYLKLELDDEIKPHWPDWAKSLAVISSITTVTFHRSDYETKYADRINGASPMSADNSLQRLYEYSVIGYLRARPGGGSEWVFKYEQPDSEWDPGARTFKVHPGLKEFANLREERS